MNEMFQIPAPQDKVNILASDAMRPAPEVTCVTTGKNVDCAAISTPFVTICPRLWME